MQASLKLETERLTRSWMQHEQAWLGEYLVSSVEDPRINLQSIFSRHFLVRALFGEQLHWLMEQEYRFSAAMNWLIDLAGKLSEPDELQAVLHALRRGADNAEGVPIPRYLVQIFSSLPTGAGEGSISNYIESFLAGTEFQTGKALAHQPSLETFATLWSGCLARIQLPQTIRPSVFEPACGSANDYRFLNRYGIARWLEYTGMDLCEKNIENARTLFPGVRFEPGNVFELAAADQSFELGFVHDLFEHLSLEGLQAAIKELCRVTRTGLCLGFFSMDEIAEPILRPVEDYHWNTLSVRQTKELFANEGFACRVVHVGTFLRQHLGCAHTHNPNAYTFFLWRDRKAQA